MRRSLPRTERTTRTKEKENIYRKVEEVEKVEEKEGRGAHFPAARRAATAVRHWGTSAAPPCGQTPLCGFRPTPQNSAWHHCINEKKFTTDRHGRRGQKKKKKFTARSKKSKKLKKKGRKRKNAELRGGTRSLRNKSWAWLRVTLRQCALRVARPPWLKILYDDLLSLSQTTRKNAGI
jgi:hypothetical protein